MTSSRTTTLALAGLLALVPIGCGDDDEGTTTTTAESTSSSASSTTSATTITTTTESTTASTESTTTTTEPTTTQSTTPEEATIIIDYVCDDGDTGSAEFSTDDIEEIDDFVNATDLCEFKGGLIEISFTAPCPSGDREVTVMAIDGAVPDIATLDLCENP